MKHLLLVTAFFLVMIKAQSQNVGIGTSTPATILDVVSTTKGILIPRLTTTQMNAIVSPANGLIITNTDSSNRIFIYTGTGWKGLSFTSEGGGTDISSVVHTTGMDTIDGFKIFTSDISVHGLTIGRGSGADSTNTAIGNKALFLNTLGQYNTALGDSSLFHNTVGTGNTSIGNTALFLNTTGGINTAEGYQALYSNTSGNFNTAEGAFALYYCALGDNNTAHGYVAANYLADGITPLTAISNSVFLGVNTMAQANNQTNQIVIGNDAIGDGDNSTVIGNSSIMSTKLQGKLILPGYGTGSNTGTALFNLATDGSGNIIEVPTSGGGGGGGDAFLANTQTFTGSNTFDSSIRLNHYLDAPALTFIPKNNPADSVSMGLVTVGFGTRMKLTAGELEVNGLRLNGPFNVNGNLLIPLYGADFDMFGLNNAKITVGGASDINIIKGGANQSTYINSHLGFPLLINSVSGTNNGDGNVLIGTSTDDATNKLQVNGAIKSTQFSLSALNTAPTSKSDTGILGEVRITSDYIYVCIATNTWVRSPLATW